MTCCQCKLDATISLSYTEREYCNHCFEEYIEKRVRKDIRLNKNIEPLDTVYVLDDGSKEAYIARHFLQSVFEDNLTVETTNDPDRDGKVVVPTNMDRWLSEKLQEFLANEFKPRSRLILLDNVLEEEIVALCRILGRDAEATEDVNMLIEEMEAKYPDTKFSLHSAFEKLEEQLFSSS
jgi:hypothetical protein